MLPLITLFFIYFVQSFENHQIDKCFFILKMWSHTHSSYTTILQELSACIWYSNYQCFGVDDI